MSNVEYNEHHGMLYMKVKRVSSKSSHHKEKNILKLLYLCEVMDVHCGNDYCGHHFIMYVSQIITLYTLNSAVCQLYLKKNWKKKIEQTKEKLKINHIKTYFSWNCSCFRKYNFFLQLN